MKKYQILSGSALKMIALITMMIDHTAFFILGSVPFATATLFTVGKVDVTVYYICRLIGRTAFPIYCFLLTEGFAYTKNRKKYGLNLLIFAVLSEPVWNLAHCGKFFYESQNAFFTLFCGFLAIYFYEKFKDEKLLCCTAIHSGNGFSCGLWYEWCRADTFHARCKGKSSCKNDIGLLFFPDSV